MSETAVLSYYLRTKFYRPPLPEDHIPRPRLISQLNKIEHYQLAALSAPAGYGKSTLASAWAEQFHYPYAWLSLDKGDNDLVIFIGYFVNAIQTIFSDFGHEIKTLAQAPTRPSLVTVISYLLKDFEQITSDFVLILDDFHVITNPEIHEVLSELFHYPLPHFRLVIVSRHDPTLPIAKLRAQSRLLEIRAGDLRFSAAEVENFVGKVLLTLPDEETIQNLTNKTEGWPVGLRLATIAIRRWGIDDHQPPLLQVENSYIIEYLVSEVLAKQSTAVRSFLLKSAILDRFCIPLCAAILEQESLDDRILNQLEREGLFIESLDNQRQWFRYHQLFREMLRHRLEEQTPADEVAKLHLQASRWLADHGFVEDAIDHALIGDDLELAANILAKHSIKLINEERWMLLESLLNKFPPETINEDPNLLLILAWLMLAKMRQDQLSPLRKKLEKHVNAASPTNEKMRFLACSFHMFAAIQTNWASDLKKAVFHARQALALARTEWGLVYAYAWIHLGTASYQLEGGQAGIAKLIEDTHYAESALNQARRQIALSFVDWLSGDLSKLLHNAKKGLDLLGIEPLFTSTSMLHTLAGSAAYQQHDIAAAEQHFRTVLDMKYGFQFHAYVLCAIGQAMIYQAQNLADKAWQMSETAVDFCLEMDHTPLLFYARAFQADLASRQGRLDYASVWARKIDPTTLPKLMPYLYQPQLTAPKIWLAEGASDSLNKAKTELQRLYGIVTTLKNIPCQIYLLLLQALLFQNQNKLHAAEEAVIQALRLAVPGGFIRMFVDLGPQMESLLKHIYMQGYASVYLQQILDAFPSAKPTPNNAPPMALIESLTEREMEVLSLLAQRLSNKEIAEMMVISPETVKRHTSNIYQKLQVKNRRQAVAKAYTLNLLVDMTELSGR